MEKKLKRMLRVFSKFKSWSLNDFRFAVHGHSYCFNIFTHLTKDELLLLYRLATELPKGSIMVEIGSYLGASSCALAAAASERKGALFCVDTWENDAMTEGPRDTYQEFMSNTKRYRQFIVPLRAKSQDAAYDFNRVIDLLFIDANHAYSAVISDLNCWLPKLRSGGWVLMHDWGWAEGVKKAVQDVVFPLQFGNPLTLPNLYAVRVEPPVV